MLLITIKKYRQTSIVMLCGRTHKHLSIQTNTTKLSQEQPDSDLSLTCATPNASQEPYSPK